MQQKLVYILAGVLIIIIIIVGIFYAIQKNSEQVEPINQTTTTKKTPTEKNTNQTDTEDLAKEVELIEKDTERQKQEIVEKFVPESDLLEFKISEDYLSEGEITDKTSSPVFNRAGKITALDTGNNTMTFLDSSLDKEKEYTISISTDTNILITVSTEIYDNEEDQNEISSSKNTIEDANLSQLKIGDKVNVNTYEAFSDKVVVAKAIEAKRFIEIYQQ